MTDTLTWGDRLVVATFHQEGGLAVALKRIQALLGPMIGSRPTFAKLLRADGPESLGEKDQFRAWLLLAAYGEDPADWGLSPDVVPAYIDPDRLRTDLLPRLDSNQEPTGRRSAAVSPFPHDRVSNPPRPGLLAAA